MATWAIGDIQGCGDALERLLDRLAFDPQSDQLWFCGDLVNRGGQSLQVLRRMRELDHCSIVVLGNHDLHLLADAEQAPGRSESNIEFDAILSADDGPELLHWLRHRPLFHDDPSLGFALVHAGLAPEWSLEQAASCAEEVERVLRGPDYPLLFENMYGNSPRAWNDELTGWARLRVTINILTRIRYCDSAGRMQFDDKGPPGSQRQGYFPWFDAPRRAHRPRPIVFGHWSALGLLRRDDVLALDTGCVWGGCLSAIRLDDPRRRPVQIDCAHSG